MRSVKFLLCLFSITCCLLVSSNVSLTFASEGSNTTSAIQRSGLNNRLRAKPTVYLPDRLLLGQNNMLTVQAPAGSQITLLISPENMGYATPSGALLHVGRDHQAITGTVPDSGVLQLSFSVPNQAELVDKVVYLDGYSLAANKEELSLNWLNSAGARAESNALTIVKPKKRGATAIMPMLPGMPPGFLQGLQQAVEGKTNGNQDPISPASAAPRQNALTPMWNMPGNMPGVQYGPTGSGGTSPW